MKKARPLYSDTLVKNMSVLRRILFLFCGVVAGFVVPGLLRIDHSLDEPPLPRAQHELRDTAGGGDTRQATRETEALAARRAQALSDAANITQAVISLSPRIVVLRCATARFVCVPPRVALAEWLRVSARLMAVSTAAALAFVLATRTLTCVGQSRQRTR